MRAIPTEPIIFLFSSVLTLVLIQHRSSVTTLQQIIVALLILLLVLLNVLPKLADITRIKRTAQYLVIFISSLFVQLLVISNGGFYSPFLTLLHLYTLGTSFLLNIQSSISFIVFSLLVLISSIYIDPINSKLFQSDPFSALLYLVSFVVIIPSALVLIRVYHLKDTLSKILSIHLQLGEIREESILKSLTELVIVTDRNLRILSVNQAVEKTLHLSLHDIIYQSLIEIIPLKDQGGYQANIHSLSIENVVHNKVTNIINDFSIYGPAGTKPTRVTIQVRPIADLEGNINQIAFVITPLEHISRNNNQHADLDQARLKQKELIGNIKDAITVSKTHQLKTQIELFSKGEEDLINALEIEDHPIREIITFEDIAILCKQIVDSKQELSQSLNVSLKFVLPKEEVSEIALLRLRESDVPKEALPQSSLSAPVDAQWLEIIVQKLIDIAVLLSSNTTAPSVEVLLKRENSTILNILITAVVKPLSDKEQDNLFKEYYGNLALATNLRLGSGLEGFIAKTVADQINLPITTAFNQDQQTLVFKIQLSRQPR